MQTVSLERIRLGNFVRRHIEIKFVLPEIKSVIQPRHDTQPPGRPVLALTLAG